MVIKRTNKACKYFPCHRGLEDCTFCYCPFYPCLDIKLGRYIYSMRRKRKIWSCSDCNWIHKRKTVNRIFALIGKNRYGLRTAFLQDASKKQKVKDNHVGVIILGHGSRLKKANGLIPDIIKTLKARLKLRNIHPAYLQLAKPDLSKGIRNLAKEGCRQIIIVPFFLFVGNHVSRDIPGILKDEERKYPHIAFVYTKNLGQDSRMAEIVADNIKEGINGNNK